MLSIEHAGSVHRAESKALPGESDIEQNGAGIPSANPAAKALHFPQQRHSDLRIGEVLVDLGFTDESNVEAAVNRAGIMGLMTGEALLQHGAVTGRQLAQGLASRYGLPFLDYDEFPVDDRVLERVDTQVARKHMAIPCARLDANTIIVAVADPETVPAMEQMGSARNLNVICALAQENDVYFMIRRAEQLRAAAATNAPSAAAANPPQTDAA
jgi:hypothetical protein